MLQFNRTAQYCPHRGCEAVWEHAERLATFLFGSQIQHFPCFATKNMKQAGHQLTVRAYHCRQMSRAIWPPDVVYGAQQGCSEPWPPRSAELQFGYGFGQTSPSASSRVEQKLCCNQSQAFTAKLDLLYSTF